LTTPAAAPDNTICADAVPVAAAAASCHHLFFL